MGTGKVRPPPQEMLSVCDEIDEAAGLILNDVVEPFPDFRRFESNVEARVLLFGMLRHLEALLECARVDLVLLPAANTIVRAIFEQSMKTRWLLNAPDVFDREARFLAHLSDEERMLDRCARYLGTDSPRTRAATIQKFRQEVEALLPAGIKRLGRIPTLEAMTTEIGESKRYATYTILSQYTHGSHFAGSIYRQNLGSELTFAERTSPSDWARTLQIGWWSFFHAAKAVENVCAGREFRAISDEQIKAIDHHLQSLIV
jgi:uncharacterized protein DUF5677